MARRIKTPVAQATDIEPPVKVRTQLLQQANNIICKDRQATHGEAEDSFTMIATYWSVYLTKELGVPVQLSRLDVSQMMVLFKVSRIHDNPAHVDNWLDQIGYSALAGEMALGSNSNNSKES